MSEVKKPKKKKLSTSALVLIISCIIIAIPIIIFLVIIISAALTNSKPSFGNRFDNDLNPAITSSQIESVKNSVSSISGVESCEVNLATAQFRVNIDTKDSASEEEIEKITKDAYDAVNKELPVSTYFKMSSDGQRMYDLAINSYNYIPDNNEDANWISYVLTKNSKMDDYETQLISSPKNSDLAKELRGEIVDTPDTTDVVDGEADAE